MEFKDAKFVCGKFLAHLSTKKEFVLISNVCECYKL